MALYDDAGRPVGAAPRSRMRTENLRHAATAVVVRDPLGRVYVHRRTEIKDVYPGRHDFAAGGVIAAGEEAYAAARRELAEELGISGVSLEPLGEGDYSDDRTSYHAFCYTALWDGPVTWQPEEVAWGDWVPPGELVAWAEREPSAFMPDTVSLLLDWVRGLAAPAR